MKNAPMGQPGRACRQCGSMAAVTLSRLSRRLLAVHDAQYSAGADKYRLQGAASLADNRLGGNRAFLNDEQLDDICHKLHQYRPIDVLGSADVATASGRSLDHSRFEAGIAAMAWCRLSEAQFLSPTFQALRLQLSTNSARLSFTFGQTGSRL